MTSVRKFSLSVTLSGYPHAKPPVWSNAYIATRGTIYKITSQRLVVERGVFSKRMEQVDLYRVVDYIVERPFGQRIMGTGNIVLEAMDKTTPEIRIDGVKTDVVALYERLR